MDTLPMKAMLCRFICWFFILASFSIAFESHAETTSPHTLWDNSYIEPMGSRTAAQGATCTAWGGNGQYGFESPGFPTSGFSCNRPKPSGLAEWIPGFTVNGTRHCPDNTWVLSGTYPNDVCTKPDAPPPPDCEDRAGQVALEDDFADTDRDGQLPTIICVDGCQAILSVSSPGGLRCTFGADLGTCSYTIHGRYIYSGNECSGGETPPDSAPPPNDNCPQCDCLESGGAWGSVNGVPTCVPMGSAGSSPVKTQQPPITVTTTPPPTPENPDPEPVTTTQPGPVITVTPAPAGSGGGSQPQVSVTTTNPDGSTSTVTTGKGTYCEQHPNSQICGEGEDDSFFGGSCASAFSCEGDAVQCAIAREQHIRNCELFDNETPQSQLGEQLTQGADDGAIHNPAKLENRQVIDVSAQLNATDGGIVGSLHDVVIPFGTASITLPFSSLNTALDWMGLIVLGFGYFSAYRIIGGVK